MTDKEESERLGKIEKAVSGVMQYAEENGFMDSTIIQACAAIVAAASENESYPLDSHIACYLTYTRDGPKLVTVQQDLEGFIAACEYSGFDDVSMCETYFLKKDMRSMEDELDELDLELGLDEDSTDTLH